jgi:chorismate mutase
MNAVEMSPREIFDTIYNRIDTLDFGYDSENMPCDTQRAALDIAVSVGLITLQQRLRIESEDRNQQILERWAERCNAAREWAALSTKERKLRTWMSNSMRAQSKVLQELIYADVFRLVFKMPE